jgi:hypothetical protein
MNLLCPIIIIGAARSGTNMLRDVVVQMPGLGTWPCDEINYIWRHGNAQNPTDEFGQNLATEPVRDFIRRAFDNIAINQDVERVVEKTCANSLRVSFVDRIFPSAQYIFIVRDGRDVVASAMKRWKAPLDLPYILRKARYVPLNDIPYYASRYLFNHFHRIKSGEQRLASWGPRFEGMEDALQSKTLAEVCALQWRRCIERSEEDFTEISSERVHRINYESFVQNPIAAINDLAIFLDIELSSAFIKKLAQSVTNSSVGKWRKDLSLEDQERIEPILKSTLSQYLYA